MSDHSDASLKDKVHITYADNSRYDIWRSKVALANPEYASSVFTLLCKTDARIGCGFLVTLFPTHAQLDSWSNGV